MKKNQDPGALFAMRAAALQVDVEKGRSILGCAVSSGFCEYDPAAIFPAIDCSGPSYRPFLLLIGVLVLSVFVVMPGCGGGGNSSAPPPPPTPTITSVTVSPNTAGPIVGTSQQFTATVQGTGSFSSAVTWMVNNIPGGNATVGTISANGAYIAPPSVPSPSTVTVQAVSVQDNGKSGTAAVTINPQNVQISISPTSASLQLGATQQFTVSVTGTANTNFSLTINGQPSNPTSPWGTIGSTGLYTAPPLLPNANVVTITATSSQDMTKTASASVTVLATAGGINISISPQNSTVAFDSSQTVQFNAAVSGTSNTAVSWNVSDQNGNAFGQISSSGLFTPPIQDCTPTNRVGVVRATSAANSGAQATTTINLVPPTPVITSVSPQPAPAEATLQISGTFPLNGANTVNYPAPNGSVIPGGKTVPLGSSSGSLSVQVACGEFPSVTSNSIAFVRQPRIRIRADKKDLAVGESVQLHATFLGDPTPQPIDWGTGISSSGIYTATTQMGPDTFVPLSACIQNTTICDALSVRVDPLAIDPVAPTVASSGSLQLSAQSGGGHVSPNWTILAGGGSLLSDGTFTAPTLLQDGGGVLISAAYGGNTSTASIAVTGSIPGLVNRIYDYSVSNSPVPGTTTVPSSIAVDGTLTYVLSSVPGMCWIDVYDTTDPIHPIWIDAAEAPDSEPSQASCNGHLFAYSGHVYEFLKNSGGGIGPWSLIVDFSFVQGRLQMLAAWPVPTANSDPFYVPFFRKGVFYDFPDAQNPSLNGGPIVAYVLDLSSGPLVQQNLSLSLPQAGTPASVSTPAGAGNLVYFLVGQPTLASGIAKLATYDISTKPPTLVSTVDALVGAPPGSGGFLKIFGSALYDGWDVFDISSNVPVRTGTAPIDFADVNPKTSLGLYGTLPVAVADVTNPNGSKTIAVLDDSGGSYFAASPVWAGKLYYQPQRLGWGIFSASAPGGQILQGRLSDNGIDGTLFAQLVKGKYLYTAEQTDKGPFVNIYDLTATPPAMVGFYSEPGQDPLSLALLGSVLYVGTQEGLVVLDISNPSSPVKITALPTPSSSLAVAGNVLYDGTTDNRLVVFDITNPKNPAQLNQMNLPDFPVNMTVAGNLLLVADNTAGLLTFSIAVPSSPVSLSQFQAPGSSATNDVAMDGNDALVAATDGGLVIVDLSTPSKPNLVSQINLSTVACMNACDVSAGPPAAVSIGVNNGIAYVGGVGTIYGMVFGFDYRVPAYPRLVSSMGYGGALDEEVLNFGFYQTQMFVGGFIGAVAARQVDISQPRNVINLYYPGFSSGSGQLKIRGGGPRATSFHPKVAKATGRRKTPR